MRAGTLLPAFLAVLLASPLTAQSAKQGTRYGQALDLETFPQKTAKQALASVIKAIDDRKIAYLVAQLADPVFIDDRVKRVYGGNFEEQVQDTRSRLDPLSLKQLKRFQKEGKWTIDKVSAVVQLEDVKDRSVRLVRKGGRWYLEHHFDR
jgi:hypothetical protein